MPLTFGMSMSSMMTSNLSRCEDPRDLARIVHDGGLEEARLHEEDHEVVGDGDVVVDDEDFSHSVPFAGGCAPGLTRRRFRPSPARAASPES